MDVTHVLKQMTAIYAGASTYVDRGGGTTTFIQSGGRRVNRLSFATAFERPHRFRYEYSGGTIGDRLVIWQEAPPANMFWTVKGRTETHELAMAIGAATGVSSGSALTVPALLMPDVLDGGSRLADVEKPIDAGEETLNGVRCLRIAAHHGGDPITLYIGAEDFLLRRIFETHHFGAQERARSFAMLPEGLRAQVPQNAEAAPDFDSETETVYVPRVDLAMKPEDFTPRLDESGPKGD